MNAEQVQTKEGELALLRENPYAEIPATPNTPKVCLCYCTYSVAK